MFCLNSLSLYALGGKPILLPSTMDSQLEAVRHKIPKVEDKIVKIEQDLATAKQDLETAKQTNDKEKERFLCDLLLGLNNQLGGLNNQLSGLQEKENILLRSQAPGKPCLQRLHTGLSVLTSFALHSVEACIKYQMRIDTGCTIFQGVDYHACWSVLRYRER